MFAAGHHLVDPPAGYKSRRHALGIAKLGLPQSVENLGEARQLEDRHGSVSPGAHAEKPLKPLCCPQ
ncbi:uncharacterized protein METZ01_LOCUS247837, partial [marine metagenome]